jgi:PE-PPE domain
MVTNAELIWWIIDLLPLFRIALPSTIRLSHVAIAATLSLAPVAHADTLIFVDGAKIIGSPALESLIAATPGTKIVAGGSLGAMVIENGLPDVHADPSTTSFVLIGDPVSRDGILSRLPVGTFVPILNYVVKPIPVTLYEVTVVSQEYEGIADSPDRLWNLVDDVNALVGILTYHNATYYADAVSQVEAVENGAPSPNVTVDSSINTAGGTTTTYLVHRELPISVQLANLGVRPDVVATVDAVLTPIVDAGYSRNDPMPPAGNGSGTRPIEGGTTPTKRLRVIPGPLARVENWQRTEFADSSVRNLITHIEDRRDPGAAGTKQLAGPVLGQPRSAERVRRRGDHGPPGDLSTQILDNSRDRARNRG